MTEVSQTVALCDRNLTHVRVLQRGGTLGADTEKSDEEEEQDTHLACNFSAVLFD